MNQDTILKLNDYPHSRAVIFAHIEGHFPSDVFLSADNTFGILFTTFDYHYTFGSVPSNPSEFKQAIKDYQQKTGCNELILFGPSSEWNTFLNSFITEINGVIDTRVQFKLNKRAFHEFDAHNDHVTIEYVLDPMSTKQVPQATVHLHGQDISFAKALMIGNKLAEVEVWTDKEYRKQGFGFDSSLLLIKYLLDNEMTPVWSCWEKKTISNTLAEKLCFEQEFTFPAHIWTTDFGPIQ